MAFEKFFPCVPDYMDWENWIGNVIIYYGQKNIEMTSEENWKIGAQNIVNSEAFAVYPVPNVDSYDNWQDWANEVTLIINGKSH